MVDPVRVTEAEESVDKTYDTSEPLEVNKVRKKAARTRATRLEFVHAAMTTEQGRAWFYDILIRCHVFSTPFDADPYRHSYRAGEANIGLQILSDIQDSAPDQYITMVKESKTRNG